MSSPPPNGTGRGLGSRRSHATGGPEPSPCVVVLRRFSSKGTTTGSTPPGRPVGMACASSCCPLGDQTKIPGCSTKGNERAVRAGGDPRVEDHLRVSELACGLKACPVGDDEEAVGVQCNAPAGKGGEPSDRERELGTWNRAGGAAQEPAARHAPASERLRAGGDQRLAVGAEPEVRYWSRVRGSVLWREWEVGADLRATRRVPHAGGLWLNGGFALSENPVGRGRGEERTVGTERELGHPVLLTVRRRDSRARPIRHLGRARPR